MKHLIKTVKISAASLIICLLTIGCRTPLKEALRLAGENRPELGKVIEHYSHDPADSLKKRAAVFLIENMPGHYSYPQEEISAYYSEILPVIESNLDVWAKKDSIELIYRKYNLINNAMVEDIKTIKADYLIHNIEASFAALEARPWAKDILFDDFCKYILPYKCAETQHLDYWRDTLSGKFNHKLLQQYHDDNSFNKISNAAYLLNRGMYESPRGYHGIEYEGPGFLSASTIYRIPYGLCDDYTHFSVCMMRSYGTPIYTTLEERNRIWEHTFADDKKYLEVFRDIFIFQCHIGCRVGDLFKMTSVNIMGDNIEYIPRKTREGHPYTVSAPLTKIAKEIIAKYSQSSTSDKLLPFTYDQEYNKAIKEIFKEAGT